MIDRARLSAPVEEGGVLFEPPGEKFAQLLEGNRRVLNENSVELLGRPLVELRAQARHEAWRAAIDYLQEAVEPLPERATSPPAALIVGGHQPELFHPGVWFKNFVLNRLARTSGAVPLNLIVDSDIVKSVTLRLPAWGAGQLPAVDPVRVHRAMVAVDRETADVPFEERRVVDEQLLASVPGRVAEQVRDWPFVPVLAGFWAELGQAASRTPLLGERIVSARRAYERRWGCHNLEVPLSRLCVGPAFATFALHLLAELPRFQAIYNESLAEYRRRHQVRSRAHPVPELAREGDWFEAPLWGWTSDAPRRARIFARRERDCVHLRLERAEQPVLAVPVRDLERGVQAWQDVAARGVRLRSRALTTTLFARLFLADLFVHGIGGAKYDELTDAILSRFHGLPAPAFVAVSATTRLPLPHFSAHAEEASRLQHELRDRHWNPQRHLDGNDRTLLARKQALIAKEPGSPHERRQRYLDLRAVTEALRQELPSNGQQLEQGLQRLREELQANAILARRDYAFCLYPEQQLRDFCTQGLAGGEAY
ncbi:MAG: hypothetical protein AB7K24_20395 [Gemmataceae bacterium]